MRTGGCTAMKLFGPFRLDTVNHCLWRAEERMSITPKAFDVLRYLVERADRLVTQDELLEELWPETYVNPEGVRKYILEIRKVLGDQPKPPLFVETFPRRGYQFIAKVTEEQVSPRTGGVGTAAVNIVGRDAAFSQLYDHLEMAQTGQRQVIFVTGEAGIGKTTLLDVFQRQAGGDPNLLQARGQCIEGFGGTEAYYPLLEALGSLVSRATEGSLVELLEKQAPTWLVQFPSLVKAEQRESLQREIVGSTRGRMVREICEALEVMSAQTPLIVVLEDLHWVDHSTLDVISALARRREPAKLLLIGTYRPVDIVLSKSPLKALKQDLLVRGLCHEIAIESLEESDVGEYLAKEFVDSSFPSGLAKLIHHNSGGNPLFMVAIVRDMVKRGLIAQYLGAWNLTAPLQDIYRGIPDTLQQMLAIQFEQLTMEERSILQSGSVAGERFSIWAVTAMLDISPASIEETCDWLANRQQFIRSVGVQKPSGVLSAHYEFRHSLYRQALYRSLSGPYRSYLHRRLGERLIPVCNAGRPELASELALHFEEGRDYEQAMRFLMLTAENDSRRFAPSESIRVLQHALELAPLLAASRPMELEIEILQRIGDTHYILGEMSDSALSYETAVALAEGAGLKAAHAKALVQLGFPAWYLNSARGSEVCRRALEVCESLDDPLLSAQTRLAVAGFRFVYDAGREEDAEVCSAAIQTIRRLDGSSSIHDGYIYVQALKGDYEEAQRQADALIKATSNRLGRAPKFLILLTCGRFGELLRMVRAGRELEDKNGEDPWVSILGESWLRALCFDFEGVRSLSKVVMRSDAEQHATWMSTVSRISCGYAELHRNNSMEALLRFSEVRDPQITPNFILHWRWRLHAQLGMTEARLQAGDVAGAHCEADGLLQSARSIADPGMRALAWDVKSRVASAGNDPTGARAYIDNGLAILDQFDLPVSAWQVHATAWDLYRGDYEKANRHRARAQELIMRVADSFEPGEPLRESFLTAPPIRRIFEQYT